VRRLIDDSKKCERVFRELEDLFLTVQANRVVSTIFLLT